MSVQETPVLAPTSAETAGLAEAFRIFNQASEELAAVYHQLQGQVEQLTEELAAANGALRQQYQEKAALTERLTLLLDALPAGVVVTDSGGRVVQANPAAEAFCGRPLAGADWTGLEREILSSEAPGECRIGERRVAVSVTPLDSAGGRILLLHDITEMHRLQAQAQRHERLAAMGEMAAQLAHQLRTPLAAALLYAGNLENPDLPAASRVGIAQKTVERLKHLERLIRDMLLFARGEVLGRDTFAVSDLARELSATCEPLARARGIGWAMRDASREAPITGNRKALVGALTNLIENAFQAAEQGGRAPAVEVSFEETNGQLVATVRDNGRGMAPDVIARLFEPFFTTRADGTGLGLAIARGVARAHAGGIDVRSVPGEGTEFIVTLPLMEQG